jgi:hypothetical protein
MQLHDRLKELKEIKHEALEGVEEIYLMAVTLGRMPTITPFEEAVNEELFRQFQIKINSIHHLDIEEFEMLLSNMAKQNSRPLYNILDNKNKLFRNATFKNFLLFGHYSRKPLKYISDKFKGYIDVFGNILLDDRWKYRQ